jgi:hypothetical protein
MPKILESCVQKLISKGRTKSSAFAICTSSLQKSGTLKKGSQKLTSKGKRRSAVRSAMKGK